MQGPIIGYVGNLSDRIDFELLKYVASVNKAWNIVLIGSAHSKRETQILELLKYDNIYFLGVKPYDEALSFIKHFNVAIIPHLKNKLTENMNPLKLYVYFSVGVPIVSTEIANIDEFSGSINVASNHQDFVKYIQQAINTNTDYLNHEKRNLLLEKIDWRSRVEKILTCLEHELAENPFSLEGNKFQLAENTSNQVKKALGNNNYEQNDRRQTKSSTTDKITIIDLSYDGICSLCSTKQTFTKKHRSFREGYECNNCKASLRYREQASTILKVFGNNKHKCFAEWCKDEEFSKLSIYEPGVTGPFRKYLANLEGYTKSFYWSDIENGGYKNGLQCQNLEHLTYSNDKFDLVITSEIMHSIRYPWKAFQEVNRVLKNGGYHIFTVPIDYPMRSKTIYSLDQFDLQNEHVQEKHQGSLMSKSSKKDKSKTYTQFGFDLIFQLNQIGMQTEIFRLGDINNEKKSNQLIVFGSKKINSGGL
jgi:hypothetical protein